MTRKRQTVIKPITDECIESMAGVTGTKGKLFKALKGEKAKGCLNTPDPAHSG